MNKVLVTGGNTGIGLALCKQLCADYNCHVFLGSRNADKGQKAVDEVKQTANGKGDVELVVIDVSSDESVKSAAGTVASALGSDKLYAIVNNAGVGFNTSSNHEDILNVNLHGPKRVTDAFLPLLDMEKGRIVNVGSGAGPMYVQKQDDSLKKTLSGPLKWDEIVSLSKSGMATASMGGYGLSKALLSCYTLQLAIDHPSVHSSCLSPGFIETNMTAGFGAKLKPEQGTVSLRHCLFADLPKETNGWFWGSDAKRSPYHVGRDPGTREWDGSW